ncbi:MAG: cytochrome c-type biogenesis protein CcmH [Deltaproteobacteria bacterium]|nr:cytochrome c-type biogenesis protein CcmH [Deltaproteobacteria bacterium]
MRTLLLALTLWAGAAGAAPLTGMTVEPANPPPTDEAAIQTRSIALAKGLRCPVCQGLSSADSQAESAVAIRVRAEELVRAGYTDAQITDYFIDRYGEWVLLAPPTSGHHLMVWLAPGLALLLGGGAIGGMAWAARGKAAPAEVSAATSDDPYRKRVLDELEG